MEIVPIKDLKENLSEWAERASKGDVILVTKYNHPYIRLVPGRSSGLMEGSRVGQGVLSPALRRGAGGRALRFLTEDREES